MRDARGIQISGMEDCLNWIDRLPENCMKATRNALRDASKTVTKELRAKTPQRWRAMVKYAVKKSPAGKLNAILGLWNGGQKNGHQNKNYKKPIYDWFKAYWANYGTLEHRDPNHQFIKPIKPKSDKRRNDVGQPRENFFEIATKGCEERFVDAFGESLSKQESTFYER